MHHVIVLIVCPPNEQRGRGVGRCATRLSLFALFPLFNRPRPGDWPLCKVVFFWLYAGCEKQQQQQQIIMYYVVFGRAMYYIVFGC